MSDFEHYSAKNSAMSRAWEMDSKAKKKEKAPLREPQVGTCEKCKKETKIMPFRSRQTDRTDGAASFGVVVKYYCEDCFPRKKRDDGREPPSAKQVRNLLRGARKGLL